jgi:hypothetical protein
MGGQPSKPEEPRLPDIHIHTGNNQDQNSNPSTQHNHPRQITQSSDGFALVNLHWASFGTGLGVFIGCTLILILLGYCFWSRRRSSDARDRNHAQLMEALSKPPQPQQQSQPLISEAPPSYAASYAANPPSVSIPTQGGFVRTPMGFSHVPPVFPSSSTYESTRPPRQWISKRSSGDLPDPSCAAPGAPGLLMTSQMVRAVSPRPLLGPGTEHTALVSQKRPSKESTICVKKDSINGTV